MWDNTPREYVISRITIVLILIYPVIFLTIAYLTRVFSGSNALPFLSDYGAYFHAALRFTSGYPIYQPSTSIPALTGFPYSHALYLYPPVFVVIFVPFTRVPFVIGGLVWNTFSLMVLWIAVFTFIRELGFELHFRQRILVALATVGYAPTMWWLGEGQIAGLFTAGMCFTAAIIHRSKATERPGKLAGIITTVIVLVKPFYLPIQATLLRQPRRLLMAFLTVVVVIGLNLLFGVSTVFQYVELISTGPGREFLYTPPSRWTEVVFRPFAVFGRWELPFQLVTLFGFALLVTWSTVQRSEYFDDWRVFTISLIAVVLAPGATAGTLTVLLPVFIYLLATTIKHEQLHSEWVFVALFLIQIHPLFIRSILQFAPRFFPELLDLLTPTIPLLQTALWGILILSVCVLRCPNEL